MKIGIDIGGVLVGKRGESHHLFDVPYSYEAIEYLATNNYLYVISYCKEKMAQKNYENFQDLGIDYFWSQYYVSKKIYKSSIVKYLGCDVMIDDNESILNDIKKHNPNVTTILFQRYNKQKKRSHRIHFLTSDWKEIIEFIDNLKKSNNDEQKDPEGTAYFIDEI